MAQTIPILIWTISIGSIALMLVRPRGIAEAYWVCGGAALLLATRLISLTNAGHAVREGLDVYLFLAGMMILAEVAREEGVFDWLAHLAADHADASPLRLFRLVYFVGIVVTALLSNDATAVVLTPAVLAVVRRARVPAGPHLFACALVANAASFVFPISNPANLVVFGRQLPVLSAWLKIFTLPSAAAIVVTYFCLRGIFRRELRGTAEGPGERVALSRGGRITLGGLLAAAAGLLVCSAVGIPLGAPTCVAAALVLAAVTCTNRAMPLRVARGVSWSILPLVAGLFVIVGALQTAGLETLGASAIRLVTGGWAWAGKAGVAILVALLSNVMNNLPVGLMSGAAIQSVGGSSLLGHAVLVGVDLGPNLSITGSLATILWLIALRREGVEISARQFLKVGAVAMPVALLASLLALWK
ncbi:MAG TPA: SLC13 family permease [Candidatus Eisenbacteria bacterium]|nr:SLC13 family permease [Candidatus Eisenbacteria bacterium]